MLPEDAGRYHADGRDASEDGASVDTGVGFSSGDSGRSREKPEKKRSGKETGACPGGIGVLLFPVRGNAAKVGGRGVAPPVLSPRGRRGVFGWGSGFSYDGPFPARAEGRGIRAGRRRFAPFVSEGRVPAAGRRPVLQDCLRLNSFSISAFSSVTAQGLPWGQKSGSSVRSHCRTS